MRAAYVSCLNRCPYGIGSHSYFLRVQGATDACVAAIMEGKVESAGLTPAERAKLDYAKLITEAAPHSTAEDVQKMRGLGWKERQNAEDVVGILLFSFFQPG